MRALVIALAIGCGAGSPTIHPPTPPAKRDPACGTSGTVPALVDGHLRCAELPFDIAFPAGSEIKRTDSGALTLFNAVLDHGILGIVVEPAITLKTVPQINDRMEAIIKGLVADATTAPADPHPLAEATFATAISFTTADGGIGLARGYLVHDWVVVVLTGGRLATTDARPDRPIGASFLASLTFHAVDNRPFTVAQPGGPEVDLPSAAWGIAGELDHGERVYALPAEHVLVDLRFVERTDDCDKLGAVANNDLPAAIASITHGTITKIAAERTKLGDVGVYFQGSDPRHAAGEAPIAAHLICRGRWMSVVTVAGPRTFQELRTIADRVAASLRKVE